MNKKEVSEIKKQFTPDNCAITRICGCYVDGEKNKKTQLKLSMYKYIICLYNKNYIHLKCFNAL